MLLDQQPVAARVITSLPFARHGKSGSQKPGENQQHEDAGGRLPPEGLRCQQHVGILVMVRFLIISLVGALFNFPAIAQTWDEDSNPAVGCYTERCDPYSEYQDPYSEYQDPYSTD